MAQLSNQTILNNIEWHTVPWVGTVAFIRLGVFNGNNYAAPLNTLALSCWCAVSNTKEMPKTNHHSFKCSLFKIEKGVNTVLEKCSLSGIFSEKRERKKGS